VLRVEIRTQLLRLRTLVALAALAAIPIVAGLATSSTAGHPNGSQGGLFGASTYSALNHALASLAFIEPQLLPIAVAMLACAVASSDRGWGTLRYLYVAPVSRTRLLVGKLTAVALFTLAATLCVVLAGLATGLAIFGWHDVHIIGAPTLTGGESIARAGVAIGYILLSMLSIAAIAFALGLMLPRGAEALTVAIGFVIVANMLDGANFLADVRKALSVHYWQDWMDLFEPGGPAHLATGVTVQLATIVAAVGVSALVLLRREPAA